MAGFGVITEGYIAEEFHERLKAEGYAPDRVVRRFTGISIGSSQDLRNIECTITKPKGNNTVRRGAKCSVPKPNPNPGRSGLAIEPFWAAYWAVAVIVASEVFWNLFPDF